MPNRTDKPRYMMKFLFARMSEPQSPSWNNDQLDWMNGKPIGHPDRQAMFKHVWDWHHGNTTANTEANGASGDATMSELMAALSDSEESVCLRASYQLAAFGTRAIPDFVALLEEESYVVRRNVCHALSAIGAPSVEPLIHALGAQNWWPRDSAAEVLGDIGLGAQEAVPALMRAANDESDAVRSHAAEALGTTGQLSPTAAPALITALRDSKETVRRTQRGVRLGSVGTARKGCRTCTTGCLLRHKSIRPWRCRTRASSYWHEGGVGRVTSLSNQVPVVPINHPREHALTNYLLPLGKFQS